GAIAHALVLVGRAEARAAAIHAHDRQVRARRVAIERGRGIGARDGAGAGRAAGAHAGRTAARGGRRRPAAAAVAGPAHLRRQAPRPRDAAAPSRAARPAAAGRAFPASDDAAARRAKGPNEDRKECTPHKQALSLHAAGEEAIPAPIVTLPLRGRPW